MNLDYIRTYVEVVKSRSISKASARLHLSQPGVTVQIQKLENEFGCKLFIRGKKQFSLTAEGKKFFRFAEHILVEHNNLASELIKLKQGVIGKVKIISTPILGEFLLPSLLSKYKENHSTIDLDFKIMADSFEVIKESQNKNGLIGFCATKIEKDDLEYVYMGQDEIVLIVYPGHPFEQYKKISVLDLVGENFIFRDINDTQTIKEIFAPKFKRAQHYIDQCQTKLVLGTINGVLKAVESKIGIALISSMAIKNYSALGIVKVVKIEKLDLKRHLYCVFNKDIYNDPVACNFIDYVKSTYSHLK
jgi:LysR family transcriptional regulator, transcriptional activator of the cysJI operon